MKLIEPSYEIIRMESRENILKWLESVGRTAYKSEDKITDESATTFIENIVKRGHLSVIEHASMSVRFIVDRGISHELVRHRLASYTQSSTRFCSYNKDKFDNQITFIRPMWFKDYKAGVYNFDTVSKIYSDRDSFEGYSQEQINWILESNWISQMCMAEKAYMHLLKNGWKPEQARSVLPNALQTEVVATANLREWIHILSLRSSKASHPQIQQVMKPLLAEVQTILPEIFGDIGLS